MRPESLGPPLGLRTHKAAVFDKLAELICELNLPPGTRLIEADLARSFGVSKTPIREALLLLQSEGLVSLTPYQGAQVTWLSLDEYEEVTFLLDALEKPAIPLVIERIDRGDLAAIGELVTELKQARAAAQSSRFTQLGLEIHTRLFGIARSQRLTNIIGGLVGRVGRRYAVAFQHQFDDAWDAELARHVGRFEGVRNGDADAAIAAVENGHRQLLAMATERRDNPLVRRYLDPSFVDSPARDVATGGAGPLNATRD